MPIISVKSEILQQALGVTTVRSAKAKLLSYGCQLIDGEYISTQQLQEITEQKLHQKNSMEAKHITQDYWTAGTSFENL